MSIELKFAADGTPDPRSLAEEIYHVLDAHRGEDIAVLRVGEKIDITEYFVLCTAHATTHVRSLTDEVEFKLGEAGVKPFASEGRGDKNSWMVLDYGTVMVHIFTRDAREFYNLDKLYSDTEKVEVAPRVAPDSAE
ncbi:iojap-related protein [Anaerotruncus sp. CAG:390]|jgi:ribosome-associated protein|nr:iojap-related protein [Anaerotruncus sp. CAG:390]